MNPYSPPRENEEIEPRSPRQRSWRYFGSLIYLIVGYLGLLGFMDIFMGWGTFVAIFFIVALPFYLMTLSFVIWLHPVICAWFFLSRLKTFDRKVLRILIWSVALAASFSYLIFGRDFIITV